MYIAYVRFAGVTLRILSCHLALGNAEHLKHLVTDILFTLDRARYFPWQKCSQTITSQYAPIVHFRVIVL